jgi:uncharacterized delta-60 repeat protein
MSFQLRNLFDARVFRYVIAAQLLAVAFDRQRVAAAARYAADATFTGPILTQPLSGPIYALPLADGGVLAAGYFNLVSGQSPGSLVRLNADGSAQNVNWSGPSQAAGFTSNGSLFQSCQLADGRILLAQTSTTVLKVVASTGLTVSVLRLALSGAVDSTFTLSFAADPADGASISGFWLLASGRILVTGHFASAGGHPTRDVAALNPDGTIDATYTSQTEFTGPFAVGVDGAVYGYVDSQGTVCRLAPNGIFTDSWSMEGAIPSALAVTSAGVVLVAVNAPESVAIVSAQSVTGSPVPVVGPITTPLLFTLFRGNALAHSIFETTDLVAHVNVIHLLVDGSFLLEGNLPTVGAGQPRGLLRLNPDLTIDTGFSVASLTNLSVSSLQPLSDGWLAVVVPPAGGESLRKLDLSFGLRSDFNADLRLRTAPSAAWALPDNSVLLQGNFANASGSPQRFVRLLPTGVLDYNQVPSTPEISGSSIATVDAAGRVYLTGAYFGIGFEELDSLPGGVTVLPLPVPSANSGVTGAQLERFSMTGVPDATFGLQTLADTTETIRAVQVDPQNRVLVTASTTTNQTRLVRLSPSGAADPNFLWPLSANGTRLAAASIAANGNGYVLADSSGNILQLQDNGSPVASAPIFGATGLATLMPGQGALFAEGDFSSLLGNPTPGLGRLLATGLPDSGWHSGLGANSNVTALQVLPDGRLLVSADLVMTGRAPVAAAILTAAGAFDFNESLPGNWITTAVPNGSLYCFQTDGSIERLIPIFRPDLSVAVSEPIAAPGDTVHLDIGGAPSAIGPVTWSLNGVVLPGASGPDLTLASAASSQSGWYTAQVATALGPVSASVYLTVVGPNARIANASARAFLGSGDSAQTIGFVVNGTSSEPALVRLVGAELSEFGVLDVSTSLNWVLAVNGSVVMIPLPGFGYPNYSGTETVQNATLLSGAFSLSSTADVQSLISPQSNRNYTLLRSATAAQSGVGLFELYLPETATSMASGRRLGNFSFRAEVGQGENLFVVGFVVAGNDSMRILVRGLGPALTHLGIADALSQPVLSVYQGQTLLGTNSGWQNQSSSAQIATAAAKAGAFPLTPGADSALLLTLAPGAYTATLQSNDGIGAVGMIELYDASN